jgi:hypothetical protein
MTDMNAPARPEPMDPVKKPSEIVNNIENALLENQRETGRITDMLEVDIIKATKNPKYTTVCCCIDPYINEKPHIYVPGAQIRDGDVYKHRVHLMTMVVCFNICHNIEHTTETFIQRASDGVQLKTMKVEELNDPNQFFLVKAEKCPYKHHDLRRYSVFGRLLVSLCTPAGVLSTCRKCCCLEDCVNTVNIGTVRCERSLYSRRRL